MRLAARPTRLVPAFRQLSCRLAASRHYRTVGAHLSPSPPSPRSAARNSSDGLPRTIASLLYSVPRPSGDGQPPSETTGNIVTIHGWIKSIRRMAKVCFAHIVDGSSSMPLQAVLTKSQAAGLSTGSSVRVAGKWIGSRPGTAQQNELQAEEVQLLGAADPETYPLQKKYHSPEFLRTIPHIRPRTSRNTTILQLRSFVTLKLTTFFAENEFVQCYPPIITSSDCEGAGEVFTVASSDEKEAGLFFRAPKYLTVSTQLHLEAMAAALPRVWALSPTFRAERSSTSRHLSEFYMLEAEASFVERLDPLLDLVEDLIRHLVCKLSWSTVGRELLFQSGKVLGPELETRWKALLRPERWKRLTYSAAIEELQTAAREGRVSFEFPTAWGASLQSEHEKYLASAYDRPVFVTDYPREIKPFYMLPSPSQSAEGQTAACFDLLFPAVGELVGGSLREHRYDELVQSMTSRGLLGDGQEAGLQWYTDLRKWGSVPHGGFGMGMDRLLCYLTGVDNIREVVAFPRWVGRCDG